MSHAAPTRQLGFPIAEALADLPGPVQAIREERPARHHFDQVNRFGFGQRSGMLLSSLIEKVSRIDGAKSVVRLVLAALLVMLPEATAVAQTTDPPPPAVTTCSGGMAGTYPCSNVDLMSFLALDDIGGGNGNDIWGWTDSSTGKEYAIMGRTNGTSFVDISDPVNPIYLGNLPPHSADSTFRDIKVYADHAFIVTEANDSGMQVFDLTQLRIVASPPAAFSETAHYPDFSNAHNLAINEDSGFAYAVGTNNCSGGLHMINIQTPTNPTSAGCFSGDGYTHDAQCVNYDGPDPDHQGKEICFNSNVNTLTIVDVTNKAASVMLSRTGYDGSGYAHQGWLTEDQVYFLLGDESDETDNRNAMNTRTYMWDVSDLDDPALIGFHESTTTATDHNQYVKGNYTYQSNYRAGLRILDITDIANGNLSEEAFFDIYPDDDSPDLNGAWSNYPFFDSGMVIVSGEEQGLFVLRPNLVDGVNPALSSASVNGAALTLTYGEALDGNSTPATDAFTVTVAGSGRTVTHVSVSGRVVTLTLNPAVEHGETGLTVSYRPGTSPIQDAVGNNADGLSNEQVTNKTPDTTAPRVLSITSDATHPTKDSFTVTITFSEEVTGLTAGEIAVTNGAGSNLAGTGASYTLDIEPSPDIEGDVTVRVPANAAVDGANLGNVEGRETFAVDTRAPRVLSITSDATHPTKDSFTVTITFSEEVTGLTAGEIAVTNGAGSNLAGTGASYTLDIEPSPDIEGDVTVRVPANAAVDGANLGNVEGRETFAVDTRAPRVLSITSDATHPTKDSFTVTITFSEEVTGLTAGEIAVTNGAGSNLAGTGASYTLDIEPSPDIEGDVTVRVPANAAVDGANLGNVEGRETFAVDTRAPRVLSITSDATHPTKDSFTVTITFSEEVTGLTAGEIAVTNGAGSNLAGTGASYTLDIEPSPDIEGDVTVRVPANAAVDGANLGNVEGRETFAVDTRAPRVLSITSDATHPTKDSFTVTITFSEEVTGLTAGEIAVTNGAGSNLAGTGASYTLDIEPSPDIEGDVTVRVPANAAVDGANLGNVEGRETFAVDTRAPRVLSITSDATHPTKDSFTVTITFSEEVTGLTAGEIAVTNGAGSNLAGTGASYTLDIEPSPDIEGDVTVRVPANAAVDGANLGNVEGRETFAVDTQAPAFRSAAVDGATLTLTYHEALDGNSPAATGDFTVQVDGSGRSVTGVAVSGSVVTLTINPAVEHGDTGTRVSYGPGANPIRDAVGNDADGLSNEQVTNKTPDTTAPRVLSITSDATHPTKDSFTVTITFSEEVTGLTAGEIAVTNGAGSNLAGTGASYTLDIEPSPDIEGDVTVRVPANAAVDGAKLGNVEGRETFAVDTRAPRVLSITSDATHPTKDSFTVTITFSEEVTGLTAGEIAVTNGTGSNLAGTGASYTLDIEPSPDIEGDVTVRVPANAAVDGAKLGNVEGRETFAVDTRAPRVLSITSDATHPTKDSFTVTITFSEEVTGLTAGEIAVTNGTGSNLAGTGASYTLDIEPSPDIEGDVTVRVPANAAVDGANLGNVEGRETFAVDTQAPAFRSAAVDGATLTLTYHEALDGNSPATTGDFTVNVEGAERMVTRVSVSGSALTLTLDSAVRSGQEVRLTYRVPGTNAIQDAAGNDADGLSNEQVTNDTANEKPGKPLAPTFSDATLDSLTVEWTEPENSGSDITDYDVQYREGGSGGFADAPHVRTGRTMRLTGLSADTAYQVQVRATNDAGAGDWSEPGEGRTSAPLTVRMTTDLAPPVEGPFTLRFRFSEAVTGFTSNDIATQQEPPCTDTENNAVPCDPSLAALQTTDNPVFTTSMTPRTERVAHNYTLTISVQAGGVTSLVGNKPNEAATLEVRIAPPGVTVPIPSIGLTANPGNGQVTLRWDAPTASRGSAIIRYEYRWAETGGEFGDWVRVDPAGSSAAVPNLTNGRDYVFEARGVNALGYSGVLTGDMVNNTYRLHGEQLSWGNIERQQCFHALERNTRHGSTHAVHLRLESRSGIKNRAVPPLRHSAPHRLQMGPALPARRPRRARGPLPSPSPSPPTNRAPGGRAHSRDPRRTPAVGRAENPRRAPARKARPASARGVDDRRDSAPGRARPAPEETPPDTALQPASGARRRAQ